MGGFQGERRPFLCDDGLELTTGGNAVGTAGSDARDNEKNVTTACIPGMRTSIALGFPFLCRLCVPPASAGDGWGEDCLAGENPARTFVRDFGNL